MDHSHTTFIRTVADVAEEHSARASLLDLPLEVLEYILPYLPPQTILSLSLASKALHHLVFPPATTTSSKRNHSLRPWRYLNLGESYTTPVPIKKPSESLYNLPPSPPPSPPPVASFAYLQNPETIVFKSHVLENVRTLILDGLPTVDTKFISNILAAGAHPDNLAALHRIQILSIRGCPKLDDRTLASAVLRERNFPKDLRGIYYFSDPDLDFVSPAAGGADVFVTAKMGRGLNSARRRSANPSGGGWWAETLRLLQGQVAFDAEMCRGQGHFHYQEDLGEWEEREPRVATMRLTKGCADCGASAEIEDHFERRGSGYGDGDAGEVLYPPAPVHNSSLASAKSHRHLRNDGGKVILRCTECLEKRYCRGCGKWWCTPCSERVEVQQGQEQPLPTAGALERRQVVSRDCFECGYLCGDCTSMSARTCVNCRGCYCVIHNEGSDPQHCEWCIKSTSHRRGSLSAGTRPVLRRNSISMATSSSSSRNEINNALSALAAFTDPSAPNPSSLPRTTFGQFSSPPTSPHLAPIPQPVILLSSRLPPLASSSSPSASSPKLKAKGKGVGKDDEVKGAPASPILKAIAHKGSAGVGGEVHRAAGMRLRTMISGAAAGGSGAIGTGLVRRC